MDDLIKQRGTIKASITRIQTYLDNIQAAASPLILGELKVRSNALENYVAKYESVQSKIENLCTEDGQRENQDLERAQFEDRYYNLKAIILVQMERMAVVTASSMTNHNGSSSSSAPAIKLPHIDLPTFSGNIQEWTGYCDLFKSLVHGNQGLSGAEKLQYLKLSLKNEPARLLQSMQVTNANYDEAWKILTNRYQNTRQIIHAHLKTLFSQPPLQSESATSLRKLLDTTVECVRSLHVLQQPTDNWDSILIYTVAERMDSDTRREWELSLVDDNLPTFALLTAFLEQRCRALDAASSSSKSKPTKPAQDTKKDSQLNYSGTVAKCVQCGGNHSIYICPQFQQLNVSDRMKSVKQKSLCYNCLGAHTLNKCSSSFTCSKCKKKHHTLLHINEFKAPADKAPPAPPLQTNFGREDNKSSHVLLSTALILVDDYNGNPQPVRALLDSGSQASLITEACYQRLSLRGKKTNITINGMGSSSAGTSRKYVQLKLHSRENSFTTVVNALVFPKVTNQLPSDKISNNWCHLSHLTLADPSYNTPGNIDILLGAEVYHELMLEGKISGPQGAPVAMNTVFGWVLSGRVNSNQVTTTSLLSFHTQISVEDQLKKFWELEEIPHSTPMSLEEKACERHFASTHRREKDGRFIVRLPFREDSLPLGNSKINATKVLLQLERRLQKDPIKKEQYHEAMRTSLRLGHMVPIPPEKIPAPDSEVFYLPHHYVLKESSSTTALRVVYNASMKTSSGVSLNDSLMVGPTIQPNIVPILIRFRTHITAFTADIAKMYPQVAMDPEHWNFQRVLWREDPLLPIQEYWLVTVTFGTASAPYLATKCLQQLAKYEKLLLEASSVLLRDFYVDDLISGDRQQSATQLTADLVSLLEKGKFNLRKWSSNDQELLESLPPELRETNIPLQISGDDSVKALGLHWHPASDVFSYTVDLPPHRPLVTKRTLLSDTSRIFDPLGLAAPTTIRMKLLFQQLWLLGLTWDEALPPHITEAWSSLRQDLPTLQQLRIPRYLNCDMDGVSLELHGFSDASEKAYSACVYLRVIDANSMVSVQLVAAKTKVAPIKQVTLPRLELCGAVLLSRLVTVVLESLPNLQISSVHGWTDSTVVLAWVSYSPAQLKTFVANRVSEIQDVIAPHQWHHVPGDQNPADCASRGISPTELLQHPLWWTGPQWLHRDVIPPSSFQLPANNASVKKEERALVQVLAAVSTDLTLLSKFSSLSKLQRVTAYVLRFVSNTQRKKEDREIGYLTTTELHRALTLWIKVVQRLEFSSEILCLEDGDQLPPKSRLLSLTPFVDGHGILRVGGRLQNAKLSYDQKFPILLPKKHRLTDLIVDQEHRRNLHAGPQLLLASLNRRFWLICGRDVVRRHVIRCIKCHRHRADNVQNIMGQLPLARTEPVRAFLRTGVDYAGPLLLKEYIGRGRRNHKCYVCVFVCFVTHAIHLELVLDLTTEAFIAALRRFIARRGKCSDIFSDNGTNFVGADTELKQLAQFLKSSDYMDGMAQATTQEGINWHFIPPSTPHFGGLWEAGVKSMKFHLRRVVGNNILTFDEMQTVLCQIEACLNSRPLCPLSSDPSDLAVLTPGHFLTFEALNSAPDPDLTHLKLNQLSRWQLAQRLQQHFWKRWSDEYLARLQQRPKWFQNRNEISIGDLVLVKDERLPPLKWIMGRVIETHPGKDGLIRVVTLKTADGIFKRPAIKLCPLPLDPTT